MARRTVDTVDVRIDPKNSGSILQLMANVYRNIYSVIIEYVQNAADDTARQIKETGKLPPSPLKITIDIDGKTGDISILDNGRGIALEALKKFATDPCSPTIDKNGNTIRAGIGVHTFRSYFKKATFRTKSKGTKLLELTFQRGDENLGGNKIEEIGGEEEDFPYESGTQVVLSGVAPTNKKPYKVSTRYLKNKIEERFGQFIGKWLEVTICVDGKEDMVCKGSDAMVSGSQTVRVSV